MLSQEDTASLRGTRNEIETQMKNNIQCYTLLCETLVNMNNNLDPMYAIKPSKKMRDIEAMTSFIVKLAHFPSYLSTNVASLDKALDGGAESGRKKFDANNNSVKLVENCVELDQLRLDLCGLENEVHRFSGSISDGIGKLENLYASLQPCQLMLKPHNTVIEKERKSTVCFAESVAKLHMKQWLSATRGL